MDVVGEIKAYIHKNGIKQIYIAEKAGIKRDALCTTLRGKRNLPLDEYCRICLALNVPFTQFIKTQNKGDGANAV
jgi:transcriptional regulator with XRE-family HTH domain